MEFIAILGHMWPADCGLDTPLDQVPYFTKEGTKAQKVDETCLGLLYWFGRGLEQVF